MTNRIGTNCERGDNRHQPLHIKTIEPFVSTSATHLAAGARNLVDYVGKHHVLIVGFHTDALPLDVLPQSHVVADKWVAHAARVRRLAVAEYDAGRALFAHPVARRLVEAPPIAMAAPAVVDVAQQLRRVGHERRRQDPFGAQRAGAVAGQPQRQRAQELAALWRTIERVM